jgi:hypothetical protein
LNRHTLHQAKRVEHELKRQVRGAHHTDLIKPGRCLNGRIGRIGRQIALAAALGQPVTVENRGGGATQIGTEAVARAAPDGYTLLLTNIALGANPALFAKLPYDTTRDLAPITLISTVPLVLIAHPSLGARSISEFVARARAKPGAINYASAGNGSANHLVMEMFRASALSRSIRLVTVSGLTGSMGCSARLWMRRTSRRWIVRSCAVCGLRRMFLNRTGPRDSSTPIFGGW